MWKDNFSSYFTIWVLVGFLTALYAAEFLLGSVIGDRDGKIVHPVVSPVLVIIRWVTFFFLVIVVVHNRRKILLSYEKHRVVFNICLLIVSTLCALLIAEYGLRAFFPGKYVYYDSYQTRPILSSGATYRRLAPDFEDMLYSYHRFSHGAPLKPWRVKTNQHGWREPDYDITKPPETKRLMVLGDSLTYGWGVDDWYSHSSYLRHALRLDPSYNWEVLNRSVPGWSGWDQLEYLRMDGERWKPDIVTVNVTMNDFKPISDVEYQKLVPQGHPWFFPLFKKSRLLNLMRIALQSKEKYPEDKEFHRRGDFPKANYGLWNKDKWWYTRGEYDTPEKRAFYKKANDLSYPRYLEIKRVSEDLGAYFLVVIYPTASQTSNKYWMFRRYSEKMLEARAIHEFCEYLKAAGIPHINLSEAFRAEATHVLFSDEAHLSAAGHRLSAQEVIKHLRSENVITLYDEPFWD